MNGHYYLIVLNLKAGRFEVMDSMRRKGDKGLMAEARKVIGSIKHFWQTNYSDSKIDISRYKMVHIPTPMLPYIVILLLPSTYHFFQRKHNLQRKHNFFTASFHIPFP